MIKSISVTVAISLSGDPHVIRNFIFLLLSKNHPPIPHSTKWKEAGVYYNYLNNENIMSRRWKIIT